MVGGEKLNFEFWGENLEEAPEARSFKLGLDKGGMEGYQGWIKERGRGRVEERDRFGAYIYGNFFKTKLRRTAAACYEARSKVR